MYMSPSLLSVNGSELKKVSDSNETARSIRKFLAERIRNTPITDLPRTKMEILRSGGTVDEAQFIEYWKALDRIGVGTYFKGRGINKDTFTWKYSLKIIAQAAVTGDISELSKHVQKPRPHANKAPAKPKPQLVTAPKEKPVAANKTVHVYLRPDFMIELNVPSDFSKEEAQQLCRSVSRLAG